jgi:Domain of unknown function (DUF4124)
MLISLPVLRIPIVLACLAAVGPRAGQADDIYRTVDAQGHVVYSDHAISADSKKVSVDFVAADPQNASRLAKQQAVVNASDAEQDRNARLEAQQQQQLAADRQRACDSARNRFATFNAGGRIYKVDDQGNRVFYSDQEINAERSSAKAAMDSACVR